MDYKKVADEDFPVKANAVRMYSIVRAVRDFRSKKQACVCD